MSGVRSLGGIACARWMGMAAMAVSAAAGAPAAAQSFHATLLVDNVCCGPEHFDPNLVQAWGVAMAEAGGPAWVSSLQAGKSTLYDGFGNPQPLVVGIPGPVGVMHGSPTGVAAYGGQKFAVPNGQGSKSPARFIFATQEGQIVGWTPLPHPPPQNTSAALGVSRAAAHAMFTGLSIALGGGREVLLAADFRNRKVAAFDGSFAPVPAPFNDPRLPEGFAPYNVRAVGDKVFVAYAQPDADGFGVVTGAGRGIVDVFSSAGVFESRLVTGGALDAPWGMALAPAGFGRFGGALLVANFGDGRVNAFDVETGALLGTLSDSGATPLKIDGVRGLEFGNGSLNQPKTTLFFTASPTYAAVGEYGRIDVVPDCYANCDGSTTAPVLNVNDFLCFQNLFAAGDPRANCDGSTKTPVLNVNDFTCFMGRFASGCP